MIDAPVYVPFVPTGRPTGSERLGLGQVAVRPEIDRALNAPEQGSAKAPFSERQAAIQSTLVPQQQPPTIRQAATANRSDAELGARARVAAGGETRSTPPYAAATTDEDTAMASSAMRQRVEVAVRLALPSEEPSRQFNILV